MTPGIATTLNNRLLILDDEKDIVDAYCAFLEPANAGAAKVSSRSVQSTPSPAAGASQAYTLIRAGSGKEALELVRAEYASGNRLAGGFFDVKLEGGMDGLQVVQEIWKIDPDVLCTVVTAYQDRSIEDIDALFGARFKDQWDYLNKPFTRAEIVQKARQMVASWNRREALKNAQVQLVISERLAAVGQVARGIGHEFGNILQAIVGKADLGLMDTDLKKVQEKLKTILQAADRAALIIRNLQYFSKSAPTKVRVSFTEAFNNVLVLVDHELKKHSIETSKSFSPDAVLIGNAQELEQVVLNLIINATHAMPDGGPLELGCRLEKGFVIAWVRDSGTGIPADVLPRIFDFAFTTKGEKGSGLGLAICKQIVDSHGGRIHVQTDQGKGTTFSLIIPVKLGDELTS